MAIPVIGAALEIVSNAIGIGRDWLQGRRDRQKARLDADIAIEKGRAKHAETMAENGQMIEARVDEINASKSDASFKDEWILALWSSPLVLAMFPWEWAQEASDRFFQKMQDAPEWYVVSWGVMIGAAYGYRKIVEFFKRPKGKA